MQEKLRSAPGKALYAARKQIVECVANFPGAIGASWSI